MPVAFPGHLEMVRMPGAFHVSHFEILDELLQFDDAGVAAVLGAGQALPLHMKRLGNAVDHKAAFSITN